jgi:hypothetical protein
MEWFGCSTHIFLLIQLMSSLTPLTSHFSAKKILLHMSFSKDQEKKKEEKKSQFSLNIYTNSFAYMKGMEWRTSTIASAASNMKNKTFFSSFSL